MAAWAKRTVVVVVAMAMLAGVTPTASAQSDPGDEKAPALGVAPESAPPQTASGPPTNGDNPSNSDGVPPGQEIVGMRERESKTFATDEPGVYRSQLFASPVHHRQGDQWLDVGRDLTPAGNGRHDNRRANEFLLSVAERHQDAELARLETEDGFSVAFSLEGARPGSASPDPTTGKSTVAYRGILPGVDLRLQSNGDGVKEELVLRSRNVADTFVFPLALDGLTARINEDGAVVYEDSVGRTRFETPPGWMIDSALAGGEAGARSEAVTYRLVDHEGGQALEVKVDRAWLDDPARVYPVTVDPTYKYHYDDQPYFYADTFYYSANTTSAYSGSSRLAIGRFSAARYRSYLQFGSNARSSMTPGDGAHYISNATLGAYNYSADNCNTAVYVKRTTQDWQQYPDQYASQLGPNYDANDSVQTPAGCVGTGWMRFNVTSMARNWENGVHPNHGFALLASHNLTDSSRSFRSQDYSNAAYHPYLEVDWRNSVPEVPSDPSRLSPAPNAVLSSSPTSLSADYSDADGDYGFNHFWLERKQSDGTWAKIYEGDGNVTSCCKSSANIPTLVAGDYRYAVYSSDGTDISPWALWYSFSVVPPPTTTTSTTTTVPPTTTTTVPPTTTTTAPPTVAPGAPGDLRSTSHLRGVSSPDRSVDMTWSPAPDGTHAVTGYRWSFTGSETPPGSTDGESTTSATSASSAELADGVWFFHVRAYDALGNLGPYASFGPLVVDGEAGLILPRLGLDPSAASDDLGLEQFFPLDSTDLGPATAYTNLDNGNLVVVDDDEDIPAQGLNVGVRHVYNSQRGDTDDGLGRGWNLSVGDFSAGLEGLTGAVGDLDLSRPLALANLGDIVDGVYQVLGQVLEFSDADGTTHRFVRRGGPGGRWESPAGVDLRVVEQQDVLGLVTAYDLVRPDGVTYRATNIGPGLGLASPTWRLTRVTDRNGNQLSYTYGLHGLQVRLAKVIHNRRSGDMVRLNYDANANLDIVEILPELSATDPATGQVRSWARTIDFDVDSGGLLGASRLMQVVENAHLPEGNAERRTTSYTYGNDDLLAGVVDPRRSKGTDFRYEANADGLAQLRFLNDRRANDWEWRYGPAAADGAHETTALSPLAVATTYTLSGRTPVSAEDERIAGGNVLSIADPGTDQGPVTTTYGWSANRMTSSTDGAGATTRMRYNDLGLLRETITPSPNAVDAPAGEAVHQGEVRNTLHYSFLSPGAVYAGCDPAAAPANPDISAEGYCATVGELDRVALAADVAAQLRITDFDYDGAGNLTRAVQRGTPSLGQPHDAAVGASDRATTTSHHPTSGGLVASIDGPRTDVADVTTYGDAAAAGFGYDATGQPETITDAAGKAKVFSSTPYGMTAAVVDRDGHRRTSSYDERDNLLRSTDAEDQVTTFAYDANDNRTARTSPRGNATPAEGDFTTTWSYDANDWMTQTSTPGPDGGARTITSSTYNNDGTALNATSARGATTTYGYWPNRALRSTDAPADGTARAISETFYDLAGRPRRSLGPVTNAEGQRPETTLSYSPAGSVASSTQTSSNAEPRLTRMSYNAHGEAVVTEGPRSIDGVVASTTQRLDPFGQATSLRRRLGVDRWLETTTGYDAAGNTTSVAQPSGNGAQLNATFAFDALDRLAAQTADPQNPGHTVDYTYDGEGSQVARIDKVGGAVVRRAETTHNPDDTVASVLSTDFDAAGSAKATMARCHYGAGAAPASGYDADGNLREVRTLTSAGAGSCDAGELQHRQAFAYDERGWMASSTQAVRSPETGALVERTQSFTYDPDAARASATHATPGGPSYTTTYGHNDAGQPTSVTDWRAKVSTTAYLPSGAASSRTLGSGVATAGFEWHADAMPKAMTWRNGANQVLRGHAAIAYDNGGQRNSEYVTALQPGGLTIAGTARYGYDLAERLTSWTSPFADPAAGEALSVSYDLDDGSNIEGATTTGATSGAVVATVTAEYPNGRLNSRTTTAGGVADTETFTYDGLGQETLRQGDGTDTTSAYDPLGHTTAVDDRTATDDDVTSIYDGTDRLISRSEPGAGPERSETTLYFYWGAGSSLAEETDGNGATLVRYACATSGAALAQQSYRVIDGHADPTDTGGTWRWLLPDVDGNVATQLNDDGSVAEQSAFDPYGKPQPGGSSVTDPKAKGSTLGFQGAITDKVTGSVVLGPRLYDPSTARFSTADSFVSGGLDVGLALDPLTGNRYLFAGANPVAFFDDGHWPRARCGWGTGCRPPASPPAAPPCSENTLDSISIHNGVTPCAEAGSPGEASRNVLAAVAGALVAIGLVRCFSMRLLEIDYLCGGKARSGAPNTALRLPTSQTWGRPNTLSDHFRRHGADFGARSADDYAGQASEFFQTGLQRGLPTKIDPKTGAIRIYDPSTNTFGAYNPSGTTRTFYRPDPSSHGYATNWDYWQAQPGYAP